MIVGLLFIACVGYLGVLGSSAVDPEEQICLVENDDGFNYENCVSNIAREYYCTLAEPGQVWLKSLYDEALADRPIQKRRRREIRTLSDTERKRLFDAVNALKNDKSVYPNKYDAFALIHTNRTLCSAHRGTNFLGWHRVFLLLFETALRQKDNSTSLPYWNSVIDNNDAIGPQNTIMFTDGFLGDGHYDVNTGPFGNWSDFRGCPLVRDIGGRNTTLLSYDIVNTIMNNAGILRTNEVSDGGPNFIDYTIEGQHNLGHDWVGGSMDILNISVNDPVFFLHHAFIDYMWEKFRDKQRRYGINPESDYQLVARVKNNTKSYNLRPFHEPNRTMDCFFWLRNIYGFWNNFTNLYEYEDSPTCPDCGNSTYLICNPDLNRCIGKSKSDAKDKKKNCDCLGEGIGIGIGIVIGLGIVAVICKKIFNRCRQKSSGYTQV